MTVRILHVDDHELTRAGCALILSQHDGYDIVATLDNGKDVLPFIEDNSIDAVLLDLMLADMNGLSLLAELIAVHNAKVIILTGQNDAKDFHFALKMGVRGIVHKSDASEEIVEALAALDQQEPYLSNTIRQEVGRFEAPPIQLSPRQAAILHYMAVGETNKEIGGKLGIATPTVSFHIAEIRRKLEVTNNKKIVQAAQELGLI